MIKLTQNLDNKLHHIGLYVAKCDPAYGQRRQLLLTKDNLLAKVGFEAKRELTTDITIEANEEYFVVPCTFHPRDEAPFTITFTVDGDLQLRLLAPESEWKVVEEEGEWTERTAGGCRNHPTCPRNPQFLIKTKQATSATVFLHTSSRESTDDIGFYIIRLKDRENLYSIDKFIPADVVKKSLFSNPREAWLHVTFPPGGFFSLLPCTFDPNKLGTFKVMIFSDELLGLKKLYHRQETPLQGEWTSDTAGGSLAFSSWRNNPQFFLLPSRDCRVSVSLTQLAPSGSALAPIGFYVAKSSSLQEAGHRLLTWSEERALHRPTFEAKRTVYADLWLEKSITPYVIIPCTQRPGVQRPFTMVVEIQDLGPGENVKNVLQILPCNYFWKTKAMRGVWKGETAAGPKNWIHNPQYTLHIEQPCSVVIVLVCNMHDNAIGLQVVRAWSDANLTEMPPADQIVASVPAAVSEESVCEVQLTAGYYIVVPVNGEKGKEATFDLQVYANIQDIELAATGGSAITLKETKDAKDEKDEKEKERREREKEASKEAERERRERKEREKEREKKSDPAAERRAKEAEERLRQSGMAKWLVDLKDVEFHKKIGQGGYGAVWKGVWKGRDVAVKKLVFRDENEAIEWRKEVILMSQFQHQNIVAFLGAATENNEVHILTEFCQRGNLSTLLKEHPDISWNIKLQLAIHAARGMVYLHSFRPPIVHRDLKSLNLLVDSSWTCKVADFGLSKPTSGQSLNSRMGSLNWCAPEILLQNQPYTPGADAYSFGLILWEFISHVPPYHGMSPLQIVKSKDAGEVPFLPDSTHKAYKRLIKECWHSKPQRRPTFTTILEKLEAMLKDHVIPVPSGTVITAVPIKKSSKKKLHKK